MSEELCRSWMLSRSVDLPLCTEQRNNFCAKVLKVRLGVEGGRKGKEKKRKVNLSWFSCSLFLWFQFPVTTHQVAQTGVKRPDSFRN